MPKNSNKGFSVLIVVLGIFVLLSASFFGYKYFSQQTQNVKLSDNDANEESNLTEVLGTTTKEPKDIVSFFMKNFFGLATLQDFNNSTSAIVFSMNYDFNKCIFVPRKATPLTIKYTYKGKSTTSRLYNNVQVYVNGSDTKDKYIVLVPTIDSSLKLKDSAEIVENKCSSMYGDVVFVKSPSSVASASEFEKKYIDKGNTVSTSPAKLPSTKPATFIKK